MNESINDVHEFVVKNNMTLENLKTIIHRFDLENINLDNEKIKIEEMRSDLSSRQRKAVIDIISLREMIKQVKKEKEEEKAKAAAAESEAATAEAFKNTTENIQSTTVNL